MKLLPILILLLIIGGMLSPFLSMPANASGTLTSTVDTGLVATGVFWLPNQRMSFQANGLLWIVEIIYATNVVYRTSSDNGVTWSATTVFCATDISETQMSVYHDGTYVYYSFVYNPLTTNGIKFRRGQTAADGTIAWSAAEQTVVSSATQQYLTPSVCVDSSGYPYIGYNHYYLSGTWKYRPTVIKSSTNDGTWSTGAGFPYELSTTTDATWQVLLSAFTTQRMVAVYARDGNVVGVQSYTGAAWQAAKTTPSSISDSFAFDIVSTPSADTLNMVYTLGDNSIVYASYDYATNTISAETTVRALGATEYTPTLTYDTATNDFYFFIMDIATNQIWYYKSTASVWGAVVTWLTTETNPFLSIMEFTTPMYFSSTTDTLGCFYETIVVLPGTCDIMFAYETTPTVNSVTITNLSDTNNVYCQKGTDYILQVVVGNGASLTHRIDVKFYNATTTKLVMRGDDLNTVPVWTVVSGKGEISSATWTVVGTTGTAQFNFKLPWDYSVSALPDTPAALLEDTSGYVSAYTAGSAFYVVNRLVVDAYLGNATNVVSTNWLKLQGNIRYALTQSGNAPSSSYPPDAQFTNIQIKDQYNVVWATDSTIVNGAFSVSFAINGIGQTQYFYVWVNIVAPYVDKLTADGRSWRVDLVVSDAIDAAIAAVFALLGLPNVWANIQALLTSFSTYFVSSITLFVQFTVAVVAFVVYGGSALYWWVNTFLSIVTSILGYINAIFTGTIGLAGTTINWFTIFFTAQNLNFLAIVLFILWFDGLWLRGKLQGRTYIEVMLSDLQLAAFVVGYITNIVFTVFNFVLEFVLRFAQWLLRLI